MIGQTLAHYRITAAIGAGGTGEVYRATDTKLGREVAIKVLPAELAQDEERLAHFEREAKLLASVNHNNIAHVYGFEDATLPDGSTARILAMELVEGEDLAERLKRGAVPVDEALPIASDRPDPRRRRPLVAARHGRRRRARRRVRRCGPGEDRDGGRAAGWAAGADGRQPGPSSQRVRRSRCPTCRPRS